MGIPGKGLSKKTKQPGCESVRMCCKKFTVDLEIFCHTFKIILLSTSTALATVGGLKSVFLLASVQTHIRHSDLVLCVLCQNNLAIDSFSN